jgi:hypothetical protein
MFKKSLKLWIHIAGLMSLVILAFSILFFSLMQNYYMYHYIKPLFIGIFITVIVISFFVINAYFEAFGIKIDAKTKIGRYLKIYFGILWRAMIILIPIIGFIAYKYHGSIPSRIATIIVEIIAGLPAIYWFLKSTSK